MNLSSTILLAGALYGATGVALGAWGAHGLENYLGGKDTGAWDTAVLYQLVHAVALIGVSVLLQQRGADRAMAWAGYLMTVGVLLFSGSIYLLVLGVPGWVGPITPMGGVCFILGWVLLCAAAVRRPAD